MEPPPIVRSNNQAGNMDCAIRVTETKVAKRRRTPSISGLRHLGHAPLKPSGAHPVHERIVNRHGRFIAKQKRHPEAITDDQSH